MKNVILLETHKEILDAHMQGESPEIGLYIPAKAAKSKPEEQPQILQYEIGKYYPDYGVYAGIFGTNHIFVEGKNLTSGKKEEFTWYEAMKLAEKLGKRLPSVGQCALICENSSLINQGLKNNGLEELDGWYWSSSEYNTGNAWGSNFSITNGLNYYYKDNILYVRPVLDI